MRSHEKWPLNRTTVDTVACWGQMSAERASQLVKRAFAGCCFLRLGVRVYVVTERQTTQTESDNKTC